MTIILATLWTTYNKLYMMTIDDASYPVDPELCRSVGDWRLLYATTSRQLSASCTVFQCGSTSSSRSPPSFTRRCLNTLPATWLTTTASSPISFSRRRLPSAVTQMLLVSLTRTNFGDRAFSASGPRVCNKLLMDLRHVIQPF